MRTLSNGERYAEGVAIGGRFTGEAYRAERERFDAALVALVAAFDEGTWDLVAGAEDRHPNYSGHFVNLVRSYLSCVDLADPRPGVEERYNRGLLAKAARGLFRDVLTRMDAGDGRFPWCHVEEACPDLAAEAMAHADPGSAFPLSKVQEARVADQIR